MKKKNKVLANLQEKDVQAGHNKSVRKVRKFNEQLQEKENSKKKVKQRRISEDKTYRPHSKCNLDQLEGKLIFLVVTIVFHVCMYI